MAGQLKIMNCPEQVAAVGIMIRKYFIEFL
jgi:hypothetical protein